MSPPRTPHHNQLPNDSGVVELQVYTKAINTKITKEILANTLPSVTVVHVGSPSVQSVEFDNLVEDTQQHAHNVSYDHPYPYTSQLLQFTGGHTAAYICHIGSEDVTYVPGAYY